MMVNNCCAWHVVSSPTAFFQSQTEVDLFAIGWKRLIEQSRPHDRLTPHEETRAKHPVHRHLIVMGNGHHQVSRTSLVPWQEQADRRSAKKRRPNSRKSPARVLQ